MSYPSMAEAHDAPRSGQRGMTMAYYYGTRGNDVLRGGSGNDFFWGQDGDDIMYGNGGNDTFYAGTGSDMFIGGAGSDTVSYAGAAQAANGFFGFDGVVVDLADGHGGDVASPDLDNYSSIENIIGSNYNDAIWGDGNANVIRGLAGDDWIEGRGGGDTLDGGAGVDTLNYTSSTARVVVDLQSNTASGGHATGDVISNFENLIGSAHNDTLSGNGAANFIRGGAGNDRINGRGGDDVIEGDAGNDILTGGSGSDSFMYYANTTHSGVDHITDFNVHQDRIVFNGSDVSFDATFDPYSGTFDVEITLGSSGQVILDNIAGGDLSFVVQSVVLV